MIATGLQVPNRPKTALINGLVSAKPLSAILAEETAAAGEATRRAQALTATPVVSGLVAMLNKHWNAAKQAKLPIEREMLAAVRARRRQRHRYSQRRQRTA